ncbi:MAG: lysine--tRNA ligase [Deltaproteobacteria bacterium]|nr:lysine--tRNA ligase [Deltaproteobacteria bacterium]
MTQRDELYEQRVRKLEFLRERGLEPYANDFKPDTRIIDFARLYGHELSNEVLQTKQVEHKIAGRLMALNTFGKAVFLRIQDGTSDDSLDDGQPIGRLQLFVQKNQVGEEQFELLKFADIGDFIGVIGTAMRTKTGELTLRVSKLRILTKSLRPLPEKWHGLSDVETRYRQRYLDLIANEESRRIFRLRSKLIDYIRRFFIDREFLEVETPMMQPIAGGAAARPFITHHNTLNIDLYLRIAPELYLKRLVVGGFERVFEINRNFRNEGISTVHNPEFTMLEFYQAYIDYLDLMDIGEELISGAAQAVLGTTDIVFGEHSISLARPFKRMTMMEAIAAYGGPAPEELRDVQKAFAHAKAVGAKNDGLSHGAAVVYLFEHFAESKLIQPTIIYNFPLDVSPLSRKKVSDPWLVDRFELFVAGRELANAFSELNNPIDQEERFESQIKAKAAGDQEAHEMDEDYVRALEQGMPPTGGFGMGIDRLVMLLTGSQSIRDVILFPQLRPNS